MYLHIGNGESVKEKEVIGIFDLDTSTVSSITKKYISENQKMGLVEYSDSDIPRAFVLVEEKKGKYHDRCPNTADGNIDSGGIPACGRDPVRSNDIFYHDFQFKDIYGTGGK